MFRLNTHSITSAAKRARALFTVVAVTVWVMLYALAAPVALAVDPGDLDTSFGGDGRVTLDIFGGVDEYGNAAAIQSDGKIVVAGTYKGFGNGDSTSVFALARFNPNGSVDSSFASNGRTLTDFPNPYNFAKANAVAIQRDGKIVVAGEATSANGSDFALARYDTNGTLDTSFSGDGKLLTGFGEEEQAYAVAIQRDGKIVAAGGQTGEDNGDDFALARYNTNGSLDTTFGGDGKVDTSIVNENLSAYDVAIQSDGKIVAAGSVWKHDSDFETIRYNTNGKPDTSFDGNGLQATGFGGWDTARAVAIQSDGKIVAVGSTNAGTFGNDFALARYHA